MNPKPKYIARTPEGVADHLRAKAAELRKTNPETAKQYDEVAHLVEAKHKLLPQKHPRP